MRMRTTVPVLMAAFMAAGCGDSYLPAEPDVGEATLNAHAAGNPTLTPSHHRPGHGGGGGGQPATDPLTIPITGTLADGTFEGTFTLLRFVLEQGQIFAEGRLVGEITRIIDGVPVVDVVDEVIRLPVTFQQARCPILELKLGPLELDLLGLEVFLDEVFLEITAQAGPGNLLGNLLCAVARLLDGGALNQLVNVLNQILGILR